MKLSCSAFLHLMVPLLMTCSLASAAWSEPDKAEQDRLDRALAAQHARFDPRENLLQVEVSSPGYHTHLQTGTLAHPIKPSLDYALALLDTGRPDHLTRAVAVLGRVLSLQDANPESRTYGIWSWFLEEPLPAMGAPDFNWADFCGTTLLQVYRDHRTRLPADLAGRVGEAIRRCMTCIQKRDTPPSYTNIAVLGSYVTLLGGETLHMPDFQAYGRRRLERLLDYTGNNGGTFEEYNSPAYTVIALKELTRIKAQSADPVAQRCVDALLQVAWRELARHFHPTTGQWAGPHSRAYNSLNDPSLLIQAGTAGRIDLGIPRQAGDPRIPLACPPELEPLFRPLTQPRTVVETFVSRFNRVGTTYLHPDYALGSVNNEDLWNQRRALLLHFGTRQKPGYMQLRFLKDHYDFASAWVSTAQRDALVVGAVTFVTDGGDTHISLDMVRDAKIRARDLRLRLEFGGAAVDSVRIAPPSGTTARIQAAGLDLNFEVCRARFGTLEGRLVPGGDDKRRWLDVIFYQGDETGFDLRALQEAVTAFVFSVGPHAGPVCRLDPDHLRIECAGLVVEAPLRAVPKPAGPVFAPNGLAQ